MDLTRYNDELSIAAGEGVHYEFEMSPGFGVASQVVAIFQDDDKWSYAVGTNDNIDAEGLIKKIHPQLRQYCREVRGEYATASEAIENKDYNPGSCEVVYKWDK